jgi:hypothetical protein
MHKTLEAMMPNHFRRRRTMQLPAPFTPTRFFRKPPFATTFAFYALAATCVSAQDTTKPDALLAVDMNRSAIVEKISAAWGDELPLAKRDAFKAKLGALRADRLLSASMTGNFDGVLEILNSAATQSSSAMPALGSAQTYYAAQSELKTTPIPAAQNAAFLSKISENLSADTSKAIGDIDKDLVYTPVAPCRLHDSRTGQTSALGTLGGVMANQTTRTLPAGGKCGIPATGVSSIFLSFHAYTFNPSVLGVIAFQKTGAPASGLSATWTGGVWVTGTTISGTLDNGSFDVFVGNGAAMTADMVVDVVGYFQSANRNGDGLRVVAARDANYNAPNVINGSAINSVAPGIIGATIAGGGLDGFTAAVLDAPNSIIDQYGTIGGGYGNTVSGAGSTIAGGSQNQTNGNGSVVGGGANNSATGYVSTVPGGYLNVAAGRHSFSAGYRAKGNYDGAFMWADATDIDFKVQTSELTGAGANGWTNAKNTFNVRATGGAWFVTAVNTTTGRPTAGPYLNPGSGTWADSSDRHGKTAVRAVSATEILNKVAALPISSWQYISEHGVRHIGPMAQDFKRLFNLGPDERSITTVDAQGVALAAIQGLNQKLVSDSKAKDAKISALEKANLEKDSTLTRVERELATIKKKLGL